MSSAGKDLVGLTRIDAKHSHDSKYNYTTHTYYGWRTEAVEECVWKRDHKPLGAGAFGTVYREECIKGAPRDAVRAVKHIDRPDLARPGVAMDYGQELEAIARFSKSQYRPFFVRSEGWFETDEHICIIMELLPLGNLHHYISSGLPEAEAVMIISQVLQGLSHMHRAGYTHRDLKPQNLLIAQGGPQWKIKIADFGLSKRLTQDASSLRTVVGTAGFVAPEVQGLLFDDDSESDDPEDGKTTSYTKAVDIWAVGVITYNVLTGQLPFSTPRLLAKFVRGKIAFPGEELNTRAISEPGHRFILELLAPNPHERLGVDECLNHSWIEISHRHADSSQPIHGASSSTHLGTGSAGWGTSVDSDMNQKAKSASHAGVHTQRPGSKTVADLKTHPAHLPPGSDDSQEADERSNSSDKTSMPSRAKQTNAPREIGYESKLKRSAASRAGTNTIKPSFFLTLPNDREMRFQKRLGAIPTSANSPWKLSPRGSLIAIYNCPESPSPTDLPTVQVWDATGFVLRSTISLPWDLKRKIHRDTDIFFSRDDTILAIHAKEPNEQNQNRIDVLTRLYDVTTATPTHVKIIMASSVGDDYRWPKVDDRMSLKLLGFLADDRLLYCSRVDRKKSDKGSLSLTIVSKSGGSRKIDTGFKWDGIREIILSQSGNLLLWKCYHKAKVTVYDIQAQAMILENVPLGTDSNDLSDAQISADDELLVYVKPKGRFSSRKAIFVLNLATGAEEMIDAHRDNIFSQVAKFFTPDNENLFIVGPQTSPKIRICNLNTASSVEYNTTTFLETDHIDGPAQVDPASRFMAIKTTRPAGDSSSRTHEVFVYDLIWE